VSTSVIRFWRYQEVQGCKFFHFSLGVGFLNFQTSSFLVPVWYQSVAAHKLAVPI
jgi:hypothetical protein